MDERDMDAIRRLNPRRLLMVGNAYVSPGTFYDSHHSKRHLYEAIRISAEDTPNFTQAESFIPGMMTPQDMADREAEWGEQRPQVPEHGAGAVPGRTRMTSWSRSSGRGLPRSGA